VAGFVYFQPIRRREARVDFRMALVDGKTQQPLGEISIPFAVRR
jgi:hypothetical protein